MLRSDSTMLSLFDEKFPELKFKLELENFTFLDTTWERPIFQCHELVPCKDLGLMVCSIEGLIIVTRVKPFSVAGEDEKVEVGDNLISIDNVILYDLTPEFIAKMIKRLAGKVPINISVAKVKTIENKVYPPMISYLKYAGLDPVQLEGSWSFFQYSMAKKVSRNLLFVNKFGKRLRDELFKVPIDGIIWKNDH